MIRYATPKPRFIDIRSLREYIRWNGIDTRLTVEALMKTLSKEFSGVVSLRNLLMASLLEGYAVVPSPPPARYMTLHAVNP